MEDITDMLEQSAAAVREVIPFMSRRKIPVTPDNYKVWFEFHFGGNESLKREIGQYIATGVPLDNELTEKLYDHYFGDRNAQNLISLVHNEAKKILTAAIENVLANINNTTEYAGKLKQHSTILHNVRDLSQVTQVVEKMITDTNAMERSNRRLQEKLEEMRSEAEKLKKLIVRKEQELLIDPLTGLYNRRALDKKLEEYYAEFKESGVAFSAIMLDVDFFKKFNDDYGHTIGDEALKIVSKTIKDVTKGADFAGRYGGEEFIILLPMTPLSQGVLVAEHIRKAVFEKKLKLRTTGTSIGTLSISLGVAQVSREDTAQLVIERADTALSLAKKMGRNNVKSEKDLLYLPN